MRRVLAWVIPGLLAGTTHVGWLSPVAGQELGFFSGVVMDGMTELPIEKATITLRTLGLDVQTDETGQFLIRGVAPGPIEVRFEAPGYVTVVEPIELTASDFVQMRLSPVATILDELLVLAGRPPRQTARAPDEQPGKTVLDLLAEMPGVDVQLGGGLATGGFVTIRGVNSFRADLAPAIYLDGIQLDNRQMGRQTYHTLATIPAESVARVRVLKGTAGTSAYSMGAPNGVILIETHRGTSTSN